MNSYRISKLQFIEHLKRIFYLSFFVKLYFHSLIICMDCRHDTNISIKNSDALVHNQTVFRCDLPLKLIIIFRLHDLISDTEQSFPIFLLLLFDRRRV